MTDAGVDFKRKGDRFIFEKAKKNKK